MLTKWTNPYKVILSPELYYFYFLIPYATSFTFSNNMSKPSGVGNPTLSSATEYSSFSLFPLLCVSWFFGSYSVKVQKHN